MSGPPPPPRTAPPIPVTTIGGYLGAGKTTLLNAILSGERGRRIAVLVNDFGAIAVDASLIVARDGEVVSLANGCACCSIAGDLAEALGRMARLEPRPDHILVEASGVALPARVADMANSPGLVSRGAVVMADAADVQTRARDKFVGRLVRDQFARADLIVLNKVDLVDADRLAAVLQWIEGLAPRAQVATAIRGAIAPELLFGLTDRPAPADAARREDATDALPRLLTYGWTTRQPVDLARLRSVLGRLPPETLRAKGLIAAAPGGGAWAVHLAGGRVTVDPLPEALSVPATQVVVIAPVGALDSHALDDAFGRCVVALQAPA